MKNLKCLLKFAFLFLFLFQNNLNAATITATSTGYWHNNIWSDIAGPQPGDEIIIPVGIKVSLNTLIDLTTPGNNVATTITVNGELAFVQPQISCASYCEVGLKLDEPSVIIINNTMNIYESIRPLDNPLGGTIAYNIYIGGNLILIDFPFGAGEINASGSMLPVELVGFNGEVHSRSNALKWVTATEENTSHFVVERSLNGLDDFKVVGRVEAKGFTTDIQTYLFEDIDPVTMSYYRLTIVDFDGFSIHSEVIVLERSKGVFEVEVFPNPVIKDVNVKVNLDKAGPVEIKIFDPSGKLVQRNIFDLEEGNNNVVFDMNGLNHQLYFINISYGNTTVSRKVMTSK